MKRKLTAALLALLMVLSLLPIVFTPKTVAADEVETYAQETVQGGAILHCFDWSYNEIKAALPDIAAAGYTAVQTSPVQQPKDYKEEWNDTSGNWWKLYQPLGLSIAPTKDGQATSWLGTRDELAALCAEADRYGIKVIVDIVANHLANKSDGGYYFDTDNDNMPDDVNHDGVIDGNDANLSDDVYDNLKNPDYFHLDLAGINYKDNSDRYNITHRHMNMPDLNTGNPDIQAAVLDLLKDCIDCGVDGFRFDAAKHIEVPNDPDGTKSDFWRVVINGAKDYAATKNVTLFIYGEVLYDVGTDVGNYTEYIALTDNGTGNAARGNAVSKNAQGLANFYYYKNAGPKNSVLWAESHDTYLHNESTNVSDDDIVKTWAIVGARADSTALFLARPNTIMGQASTDTTWKCKAVAEINKFKNHFNGTTEYISSEGSVAYIERGTNGAVLCNLGSSDSISVTAHQLKDGTYTDQVSGNVFTVSNSIISGTVDSSGVAVLYDPEADAFDYIRATTLYLVPNSNWKQDTAWFAAYFFSQADENAKAWAAMTPVEDDEGVYSVTVPTDHDWTNVIFCRMDPGKTIDDKWSAKWNQTGDLFPDSGADCYTLTNDSWDGEGSWSIYGNSYTSGQGYYLIGTMTNWEVNPSYKMTLNTGASTEEYSFETELTTQSQFKVVYSADGNAKTTWFPDQSPNYGQNGEITTDGTYTIYFRPSYDGGEDWFKNCLKAVLKEEPAAPEFKTINLVLSGQIGLNFFMDLSGLTEAEKQASYMTFTISGRGTVSGDRVFYDADFLNRDGSCYGFTCYINSIQMADTVTATFHYGSNLTVSQDYSCKRYITTVNNNPSGYNETTINLIHALADYGHYTQLFLENTKGLPLGSGDDAYMPMDIYFANPDSYDYDYIAEQLRSTELKKVERNMGDPNIEKVASFSLILDSETGMKVFFTPAETFTGIATGYVNSSEVVALEKDSSGRFIVVVPNISAHQLGDKFDITVYTDESGAYTYVSISPMAYVYQLLTSSAYANNAAAKNGGVALYTYWKATTEYRDAHPQG